MDQKRSRRLHRETGRQGDGPRIRRAEAEGTDFRARDTAPSGLGFPAASGMRASSSLNPEIRGKARTSRKSIVSIDTRCASLVKRSRNGASASRLSSIGTISPIPRRSQLNAVGRGILTSFRMFARQIWGGV